MILQRSLARILQEWLTSENTCKNGIMLQVQKIFGTLLKESYKETPDLPNRHFMQQN